VWLSTCLSSLRLCCRYSVLTVVGPVLLLFSCLLLHDICLYRPYAFLILYTINIINLSTRTLAQARI
jgi:hypothetical protein